MTAITPLVCEARLRAANRSPDIKRTPIFSDRASATVESKYFREKAAQCRRLAANIVGDPTAEALLRLADEFEAKAAAQVARERAALANWVGKRPSVKSKKPRRKKK